MSLNIHCSNRPSRPNVSLLLLIFLLTAADRSPINAQRANAELVHHSHHYPGHSGQPDPRADSAHADAANDEHNDLDLYDEPLWFEESEFSEHSADDHHQRSPFKSVIHAAQLDASLGLTVIPSVLPVAAAAIRPEPQTFYLSAILPIHKRKLSENKTQICSNEINSPAIYDLEAILWTLDQINQYAYKNGLIINLVVLDSCSSPAILERRLLNLFDGSFPANRSTIDLPDSLPPLSVQNIVGFVSSIPSAEFSVAHRLLSALNITLISAQDISFLPAELGFDRHALQTALPIEYFASAALQHLRQQNRHTFSVIYSNESLQSTTMLDALVKWITLENSKDNQLRAEKKRKKPASFCMQSVLDVPSQLNTGEASQFLIQLQNELKNSNVNASDENIVLVLTESHTTRELLIAYQHLLNAGVLGRLPFVLIKESNLNIVTGIESSMLNTLVIRESQKSLRDFVEYFEQLKAENNLRNPFFKQYWQQSANCGLNRDCLFDQIEPINTINTIQSTFALTNSIITIRNQFCASRSSRKLASSSPTTAATGQPEQAEFCVVFNNSLNSSPGNSSSSKHDAKEKSTGITSLKAILLGQLLASELDLHQLSKHFNHEMKFTQHGHPEKSVDVLKFRIVNQAYRFDRIANYLNSGLGKEGSFRDSSAAPLTSLVLKHQLLACPSASPRHSSLTRSDLTSSSYSGSPYTSSSSFKKLNSNLSQSWWRCWYSVATIASLIGALISVICAVYFLFTFDYKVGSTILGYMILLGIFLLYIVNFFFIFPYSFVNCWIRCYLMSVAYTIVLSSMLVKVMNSWRLHTYHNYNNLYIQHLNLVNGNPNGFNNFNGFNGNLNQNTNLFLSKKLNSISTLMSMCLGLVSLESLTNLVWLTIYPPRPQQIVIDGVQQWKCYNIQFAVLIETDSIFSVLFAVLLILITMFFSCLTWKHSAINSYESRWIAFSCYVMLITWTVYGFLFKMFHLIELRDLFIVIANLLVSTSILICMFIRKLIIFYRLNKTKKYNNNKAHHLVSSPSISSAASYNGSLSSYYGAVNGERSVGRANSKKINEQLKRTAKQSAKQMTKANRTKGAKRKTSLNSAQQEHLDNVDNVSTISAVTTTSSIISSVKSYFNKHHKPEEPEHQIEPDFHLSSITTAADPSRLGSASQQTEFYPMDVMGDVYETYDAGRQQSLQNSSQQPDSLFYTTKKSIFNSNHSLYAVDYT